MSDIKSILSAVSVIINVVLTMVSIGLVINSICESKNVRENYLKIENLAVEIQSNSWDLRESVEDGSISVQHIFQMAGKIEGQARGIYAITDQGYMAGEQELLRKWTPHPTDPDGPDQTPVPEDPASEPDGGVSG